MYQNHYLPLQSLGRVKVPYGYNAGFCKWWYTPIEFIASFPAVNPVTQLLISEPVLHAGKTWYGPVNVPSNQTGWEEDLQRGKPGIYYKEKVTGYQPGMSARSHINLQNLALHQVCIVGKLRCSGHFIILGSDVAGLDLSTVDSSGSGTADAPGTKLEFTSDSKNKALILPSFSGLNTTLPPDATAEPGSSTSQPNCPMETIFFNNQTQVIIPYTSGRRANFGDFPEIQVWITDGVAPPYILNAVIEVDQPPPNQTAFTVNIPGPVSGFIILK